MTQQFARATLTLTVLAGDKVHAKSADNIFFVIADEPNVSCLLECLYHNGC